ncbi:hypothetical protein SMX93_004299 [Cronobacter turicensis]|nr:hypothetical protein [Cronobacter turicensis]
MLKFIKEIQDRAHIIEVDEKGVYESTNRNIQLFLKGEDDFSFEYYVNPKVGYRKVQQDICDVLEAKTNEISLYARDFIQQNNKETFYKLINAYYQEYLALLAAHRKGRELPARLDTNLASLGLLASCFFSKQDQLFIAEYFNAFLEKQIQLAEQEDYIAHKRCYGAHTLLPLYICMSDCAQKQFETFDKLDLLVDGEDKPLQVEIKDNFTDLYSKAYENHLSDDDIMVKSLFENLCNFHINHCRSDDEYFYDFDSIEWQFMPSEILVLIKARYLNGKPIDFIKHELIDRFLPFISCGDEIITKENAALKIDILKRL